MTDTIAQAGGLFAVLVFNHFIVDWGLQTHLEAMNKSYDPWVRGRHCAVYALGFLPMMVLLDFWLWEALVSGIILYVSHFVIDTYKPVYLWAKYIRRIPEVRLHGLSGFKQQFREPLGLVLFITIDQILHLVFLWPMVFLAM